MQEGAPPQERRGPDLAAVVDLAESLMALPHRQTRAERTLRRLLDSPEALRVVIRLCDEVLRADQPGAQRSALESALTALPSSGFSAVDRMGLESLGLLSHPAPRLAARLARWRVRSLSAALILDADDRRLRRHLERRQAQGFSSIVNLLGEAVLGQREARARLEGICALMARPEVHHISVKLSAVMAQINPLALEEETARAVATVTPLLEAARTHGVSVTFDMEEFHDAELTLDAFRQIAAAPTWFDLGLGVVLQAYLPFAHDAFTRLAELARERQLAGGRALRVRLVKGANLAMEIVEADQHGWVPAPYATKAATDASWIALVDRALEAAPMGLEVGVATHNSYDAAWAIARARALGVEPNLTLEMLEGMAEPQARAWVERGVPVQLYTPVTPTAHFDAAVAYLVRRLDENTAPENFLRALFSVERPGVREEQRHRFEDSVRTAAAIRELPTRPARQLTDGDFRATSDLDYRQHDQRQAVVAALREASTSTPAPVPPLSVEQVEDLLENARSRTTVVDAAQRRSALLAFARLADRERLTTASLMAATCDKVFAEANTEISEAADFAALYATAIRDDTTPLGVVTIAPPWNFPYAIACGGVVAALAAGNVVVLKPAPEARQVAAHLVDQFWRAGIPRSHLLFAPTDDDAAGRAVITGADAVVLTGSREAAETFWSWDAELTLLAETSGKNSMVITGRADLDQAVRDLVTSAFGHAGQKCSAASLAFITQAVAGDPRFWEQLRDAVSTLVVGPASSATTVIPPVIAEPSPTLARALTELDPGESWFLQPRCLDGARTWTPGVRVGTQPGSWATRAEWFGPVLAVLVAADLDEAIALQNSGDFGLTAGLASLDEGEIARWVDQVRAGNLYVNRPTTGAVVHRQPFGGWRASSFGPTTQAGQRGYVDVLAHPPALHDLEAACRDLEEWWRTDGAVVHHTDRLPHELNLHRQLPYDRVVVRVGPNDPAAHAVVELVRSVFGVAVEVSAASAVAAEWPGAVIEPPEAVAARVGRDDRVRWWSDEPPPVSALARVGVTCDRRPLAQRGADEGPRWFRGQSLSVTAHRLGNLHAGPRLLGPEGALRALQILD